MIVIGTAGHIDHGKSAIVKRLTSTDPDRLPEEKVRGMTIDLGFAFYRTPLGDDIAFVDVPGHERFVKNMIAGAGGIDVAMLVVAADDGWMPQSQEHFQVVRLLGINSGLIVINKIDLVESDWLELLQQDIKDKVRDSFLSDAPIFQVSAETGEGFESLCDYLDRLPRQAETRKDIGKARLYIDRSFVRPGIGGVVTGTLRGGSLSVGQSVSVWPSMTAGKVRSLQSNNRDVQTAVPGQRTAVSFTGIDKELLVRGGVVSDRLALSFFKQRPVLALSMELIGEAPVTLVNRRRILLMVGTTEMEGEIRLLNRKEITPGEKGVVFFKPDKPVYCLVGDHYVARLPTPMVTLGGGQILDHLTYFPRRRQTSFYSYLEQRLSGTVDDLVTSELQKVVIVVSESLLSEADFSESEVQMVIAGLVKEKVLDRSGKYIFHVGSFNAALERFTHSVAKYLEDKPHLAGLSLEPLVRLSEYDEPTTEAFLKYLVAKGSMTKIGDKYDLAGRGMSLKGAIKDAHDGIMKNLKEQPYAPPTLSSLTSTGKSYKEAIKFVIDSGEGYKCGPDLIFLSEVWQEIVRFVKMRLRKADLLAVTDLRERFGFTRKYVIPILEETDRIGLTRREGDVRVRGDRFESEEFDL
jgi:selenocysteine-specific elongation factor